ncbi:hypothetical protein JZ751_001325 [Albula glossodonta]|uniref:Uncharacterized protein n=1 Tax=Albula glossodonta TaxID=121402 RepID=A0A8T2PT56_9TELE|nr:hypothetical protein JZ751_001325 [Albula glossodonta]
MQPATELQDLINTPRVPKGPITCPLNLCVREHSGLKPAAPPPSLSDLHLRLRLHRHQSSMSLRNKWSSEHYFSLFPQKREEEREKNTCEIMDGGVSAKGAGSGTLMASVEHQITPQLF